MTIASRLLFCGNALSRAISRCRQGRSFGSMRSTSVLIVRWPDAYQPAAAAAIRKTAANAAACRRAASAREAATAGITGSSGTYRQVRQLGPGAAMVEE